MTENEAKIAYAAGLFDGEGTIVVMLRKAGVGSLPTLTVAIHMTNVVALQWMQKNFGGRVHVVRRTPTQVSRNWRQCYMWRLNTVQATDFLRLILPHLIIKRPQAERAIALRALAWSGKGSRKVSPERLSAALELRQQIISLNRTGTAE